MADPRLGESKSSGEWVTLPSVPRKVDLAKLQDNGKFFDEKQIAAARVRLSEQKDNPFLEKKAIGQEQEAYMIGDELYVLDAELASGGSAIVYAAQNQNTGAFCAVKVTKRDEIFPEDKDHVIRQSFEHEQKVADRLGKGKGEVVARAVDVHEAKEVNTVHRLYLAMELAEGRDIKKFVLSQQTSPSPLPAMQWLDIGIGMIESIEEMNRMGFIHCDIKPENWMYDTASGRVVTIDFGEAREIGRKGQAVDHAAASLGSEPYKAPELSESKRTFIYNEQTQVYAIGKSLEELFGLRGIYDDNDALVTNPTAFSTDPHIISLINRMTHPDPSKRGSLAQAKAFLNNIREEFTPLSRVHVGIVDIREYANADETTRAHIRAGLKEVGEVVFVDTQKGSKEPLKAAELVLLRRELEKDGINVRAKMLLESDLSRVPELIEKEDNKARKILRTYVHFSAGEVKENPAMKSKGILQIAATHDNQEVYKKQISKHLSGLKVSDKDFDMTMAALKEERDRLQQKYHLENKDSGSGRKNIAKARAAILDRTIKMLEGKKGKISYNDLSDQLSMLEARMMPTGTIEKFLGIKSEGSKIVGKVGMKLFDGGKAEEAKQKAEAEAELPAEYGHISSPRRH